MAVLLRIQWLERVSCPDKVAAYLLYVALDLIGIQATALAGLLMGERLRMSDKKITTLVWKLRL